MCMIDYADDPAEFYHETMRTARKQHKCLECYRSIEPGEQYERVRAKWDGNISEYKTCQQCLAVREWLNEVCSGFIFGCVRQDLHEHWQEGYGIWLGKASVWMKRKWHKRDGTLAQPMTLPENLPTPH